MEKTTGGLELDIVTNTTFDTDDIQETIVSYGQNFAKLENQLKVETSRPDDIEFGQHVEIGKKLWNSNPNVGDYVGWVNIREGKHCPAWKPKEHYTVGQEIRATPDNGNVYKCVSAGRSMIKNPTFLLGNGVEFYDAVGNKWFPSYNYEVNDVVFALNGSKLFYYICETAGITDTSEPDWTSVLQGTTVIDGSVVWRKEANVKWKQIGTSADFRPFGKIE